MATENKFENICKKIVKGIRLSIGHDYVKLYYTFSMPHINVALIKEENCLHAPRPLQSVKDQVRCAK